MEFYYPDNMAEEAMFGQYCNGKDMIVFVVLFVIAILCVVAFSNFFSFFPFSFLIYFAKVSSFNLRDNK